MRIHLLFVFLIFLLDLDIILYLNGKIHLFLDCYENRLLIIMKTFYDYPLFVILIVNRWRRICSQKCSIGENAHQNFWKHKIIYYLDTSAFLHWTKEEILNLLNYLAFRSTFSSLGKNNYKAIQHQIELNNKGWSVIVITPFYTNIWLNLKVEQTKTEKWQLCALTLTNLLLLQN